MQQYMHVHISEKGLLINVAIIHQVYNILFSLKSTVMNAHVFYSWTERTTVFIFCCVTSMIFFQFEMHGRIGIGQ